MLDENVAKIVANLVRIAVIERDKEARFELWEREIVDWLNEIYLKCENLDYRYRISGVEYYDAVKRAFIKPKVVIDTALMDFCDDDLYESDKDKADFRTLESISHERLHRMIYEILCEQFKIMKELNWHKKAFTRNLNYSAIKWRRNNEEDKKGRLTKYGILWRNISDLRQKIDDFVKFLRYDLWLNITGKQNSVEYISAYFSAVANLLIKIAFYGGDDRAQRVEQWKRIADAHLKNIGFMGRNCDEKLSYYWRHWHLQPKNQLTYKDYIYAIESCRVDLFKAQTELMTGYMEDSIDAQNLPYKQKREKIIALHNMGIGDLADRVKLRKLGNVNIVDTIRNLLKEECKAIVKDSYKSPYNGINPNNPYYLQLLDDTTHDKQSKSRGEQ